MPVKIKKVKGGYKVSTPHGTKAKKTTKKKAEAQERLLNAVEHGWWEEKRHYLEMDALGVSELSEAFEEYRNQKEGWEERFYTELADFYIRGMDEHIAKKNDLITGNEIGNEIPRKIARLQSFVCDHGTSRAIMVQIRPRVSAHGGYSPI